MYIVHKEQGEYDDYMNWIDEVLVDEVEAAHSEALINDKARGREPLRAFTEVHEVMAPRGFRAVLVRDYLHGLKREGPG